ncbi:MAG TPA: tetratricopeptide repeat protein [Aridibacter sp.]|nr:tetratricopeptide repeat protein [Aridibacter sp.]
MSPEADGQGNPDRNVTPPREALAEAARQWAGRKDPDRVRKALEILQGARNPDNRNFEVEAAFAKYSWFLGSRKQLSYDQAEKVLKDGLEASRIARRLKPEEPDGHFWEAAIIGEQAERAPVTVGIVSIDKIRSGMQKVLEIEPGFEAGSAYMGLGRLELNTRGLAGGSAGRALEYLEKGFENHKDNAYMYLYLAEAYFATDQYEKAKEIVAKLRELEPDPDYVPEYEEALEGAESLLKQKTS